MPVTTSKTVTLPPPVPVGATAYLYESWADNPSGTPRATAITSTTVSATNTVTFSGLLYNHRYIIGAQNGSTWYFVTLNTEQSVADTSYTAGDLTVSTDATIGDDLTVGDDVAISGTLTVGGARVPTVDDLDAVNYVTDLGGVADGATDNAPILEAALASRGTAGAPWWGTIYFPGGDDSYYFSRKVHITRQVHLLGDGAPRASQDNGTVFEFAAGVHGLCFDSAYEYTYPAPQINGFADWSRVTNIQLRSQAGYSRWGDQTIGGTLRSVTDAVYTAASTTITSATAAFTAADVGKALIDIDRSSSTGLWLRPGTTIVSVTNSTTIEVDLPARSSGTGRTLWIGGGSGLNVECPLTLDTVLIDSFGGHGVDTTASVLTSNANCFRYSRVWSTSCRHDGFHLRGGDSNAGTLEGTCSAIQCGGYGVWDRSGLGNTYVGVHTSSCALAGYNIGAPAGVNSSVVVGCYSETDQPVSTFGQYVVVIGGTGVTSRSGAGMQIGGRLQFGSQAGIQPVIHPIFGMMNEQHAKQPYVMLGGTESGRGVAFRLGSTVDGYEYAVLYDSAGTGQFAFRLNGGAIPFTLTTPADPDSRSTGLVRFGTGFLMGTGASSRLLSYGTAAPASGTYKVGDIVLNSTPSAGGTIGWVCTTAGTPGTWKTWGAIAA